MPGAGHWPNVLLQTIPGVISGGQGGAHVRHCDMPSRYIGRPDPGANLEGLRLRFTGVLSARGGGLSMTGGRHRCRIVYPLQVIDVTGV